MLLGIDLGFGNVKIWGDDGKQTVFPCHVATMGSGVVSNTLGIDASHAPIVSNAGNRFFVGKNAHKMGKQVVNMTYRKIETGSPDLVSVLYAALSQHLGHGNLGKVTAVVGLPIEPFMQGQEEAQKRVAKINGWLTAVHQWAIDDQHCSIDIEKVVLVPQARAALFDYILNDGGSVAANKTHVLSQQTGVISVGHNTMEMFGFEGVAPIPRFITGSRVGVRRLAEMIAKDTHLPHGDIDQRIRSSDFKLSLVNIWAGEVTSEIERQWGDDWRRFDRIILVGGGALLLNGRLDDYFGGRSVMADDAIGSVASGLYKLGKHGA